MNDNPIYQSNENSSGIYDEKKQAMMAGGEEKVGRHLTWKKKRENDNDNEKKYNILQKRNVSITFERKRKRAREEKRNCILLTPAMTEKKKK